MTEVETKVKKSATVIETVTMLNGEVVDFPGARKLLKSSFVQDGQVGIKLQFRNGETRTFLIPDSLLLKFAAHGAEQKFGDEMAGIADLDDAVLAIDELNDQIQAGDWGKKRETNGMAGQSILVKALVEGTGKSVEQVRATLATKTHAEKVALRGWSKIAAIVARLEAEKASKAKPKAAVDVDAIGSDFE